MAKLCTLLTTLFLLCSSPLAAQDAWPTSSPRLEFVMQLRVTLGQTFTLGPTAHGRRTVVPITGGTFSGPLLRGTILSGGADYQLTDSTGRRTELDAIYTIRTDDGCHINVRNRGLVTTTANTPEGQPATYFKAAPQFEAPSDSPYAWLADALYVCAPDFSVPFQGIVLNVWKVK